MVQISENLSVLFVLGRGISQYIPPFSSVWNMNTICARRMESYHESSTGIIDSSTQTGGTEHRVIVIKAKVVSEDNPSLYIGKWSLEGSRH